MVVYSVHDVVADTWSFPQVSPTKASVARDFERLKSQPNVPAADLECCLIGCFDPNTGKLIGSAPVVLVPADRKEDDEVQHQV